MERSDGRGIAPGDGVEGRDEVLHSHTVVWGPAVVRRIQEADARDAFLLDKDAGRDRAARVGPDIDGVLQPASAADREAGLVVVAPGAGVRAGLQIHTGE